jgi:hypothetical protein
LLFASEQGAGLSLLARDYVGVSQYQDFGESTKQMDDLAVKSESMFKDEPDLSNSIGLAHKTRAQRKALDSNKPRKRILVCCFESCADVFS